MANVSSPLSILNTSNDDNMMDPHFSIMEQVARRNVFVGAVSIVISLSSGVLIVIKNLKRAVKVLLINLIICDVMVMIAAFIYGTFAQMDMNAGNKLCLTIVYLITHGSLLSNGAVLAISVNNFIAIVHPYRYNETVTTKSVLIGLIALWIGLAFWCLGSVGIQPQPGPTCAPLATIPRYGILMICIVAIPFSIGNITINVMLCIRLRTKRRNYKQQKVMATSKKASVGDMITSHRVHVSPGKENTGQLSTVKSCIPMNETDNDQDNAPPSSLPKEVRGLYQHQEDRRHQPQQKKTVEMTKTNGCTNQELDFSAFGNVIEVQTKMIEHSGHSTHDHSKGLQSPHTATKARFDKVAHQHSDVSKLTPNHSASQSSMINTLQDFAAVGGPEKIICSHTGQMFRRKQSLPDSAIIATRSKQEVPKACQDRLRNVSVTMIIIALWCCLFNIPFLAFMIYVGAIADNRVEANYSVIGVVSTTCLVINNLGNPLIYAWRFIDWKILSQKICSIFWRGKSG